MNKILNNIEILQQNPNLDIFELLKENFNKDGVILYSGNQKIELALSRELAAIAYRVFVEENNLPTVLTDYNIQPFLAIYVYNWNGEQIHNTLSIRHRESIRQLFMTNFFEHNTVLMFRNVLQSNPRASGLYIRFLSNNADMRNQNMVIEPWNNQFNIPC